MTQLLATVKKYLVKNSFIKSVTQLTLSTVVAQGLLIVSSPLITRLYTPEHFGVLAVYTSIVGLLLNVTSLKFEHAVPLPKSDGIAANVLALAVCILFAFISLITLTIAFLIISGHRNIAGFPLDEYYWILLLGVMGGGLYQIFNFWAIRSKSFKHIAYTNINKSITQVVIQVGAGWIISGPFGLLFGNAMGQGAGSSTLIRLAYRKSSDLISEIKLSTIKKLFFRYSNFPLYSSPSSLLYAGSTQLPALLFASLYSVEIAGLYALTQRVIALPMKFLGKSIKQVFYGEASTLLNKESEKLKKLFESLVKKMIGVSLLPTLILAFWGKELFVFVFGNNWAEAGVYAQILAPMFLLQFVSSPLSQILNVLEKLKVLAAINFLNLLLAVFSVGFAYYFEIDVIYTIVAYSISISFIYLFKLLISFFYIKQRDEK